MLRLCLFLLLLIALPLSAQDPWHQALNRQIADEWKLPKATDLLGTEEQALSRFELTGPAAANAKLERIAVTGMPFTKALRATVDPWSGEFWHVMVSTSELGAMRRGTVLLATLWARGRVPGVGGSKVELGIGLKRRPPPNPTYGKAELVLDDTWRQITIPFTVEDACAIGELEWVMPINHRQQQIDLGGFALLDFSKKITIDRLPGRTAALTTYDGRDATAAWRKTALARIATVRTAPIRLSVRDEQGRPVHGATVRATLERPAFRFGTSLVPSYDWDLHGGNPRGEELRRRIRTWCTGVSTDIDLKFDWWRIGGERRQQTLAALQAIQAAGLPIHGHVLIWPSLNHQAAFKPLAKDPAALRQALRDHLTEVLTATKGLIERWDVVNEPATNREITAILGDDSLAEWFTLARQVAGPSVKLYLNEAIVPGSNPDADDQLLDQIKRLQRAGAPIDGIGVQMHLGERPIAPERFLAALDRLATTGLTIHLSEYDLNMPQDRELEHDQTRDLLIAAYSHPAVDGITVWGLSDPGHWLGYAPLLDEAGKPKPAGRAWQQLVLKDWRTDVRATTDAAGQAMIAGHFGGYRIEATADARHGSATIDLSADGAQPIITLAR